MAVPCGGNCRLTTVVPRCKASRASGFNTAASAPTPTPPQFPHDACVRHGLSKTERVKLGRLKDKSTIAHLAAKVRSLQMQVDQFENGPSDFGLSDDAQHFDISSDTEPAAEPTHPDLLDDSHILPSEVLHLSSGSLDGWHTFTLVTDTRVPGDLHCLSSDVLSSSSDFLDGWHTISYDTDTRVPASALEGNCCSLAMALGPDQPLPVVSFAVPGTSSYALGLGADTHPGGSQAPSPDDVMPGLQGFRFSANFKENNVSFTSYSERVYGIPELNGALHGPSAAVDNFGSAFHGLVDDKDNLALEPSAIVDNFALDTATQSVPDDVFSGEGFDYASSVREHQGPDAEALSDFSDTEHLAAPSDYSDTEQFDKDVGATALPFPDPPAAGRHAMIMLEFLGTVHDTPFDAEAMQLLHLARGSIAQGLSLPPQCDQFLEKYNSYYYGD